MLAKPALLASPDPLPDDLLSGLKQLASVWKRSIYRLRLCLAAEESWDRLITEWIEDKRLPLLLRSAKGHGRGERFCHQSGRGLVRADNSPAWWSYALAYSCECPSLSEINQLLDRDEIPIAFIALKPDEKACNPQYKCTRILNLNIPTN
jgi:hypothetical protein